MKKTLLTSVITTSLAVSAQAQGTVAWNASAAHGLVRYTLNWGETVTTLPTGNPATIPGYGQINIAAYYAPPGTALGWFGPTPGLFGAAWHESANVWSQSAPLAGNTPGVTFTLPTVTGGENVQLIIVGWTGTYTDWNSAYSGAVANPTGVLLGWSGSNV